MRHHLILVPLVLDKVHRLPAGAVSRTMLSPVSGVAGRYAQIQRLRGHGHRRTLDDDGLRVDDHGLRKAADVDTPVKAGLAHLDRDAHVGRQGGLSDEGREACEDEEWCFHDGTVGPHPRS